MLSKLFGAMVALVLMTGGTFAADHDADFVMKNITNHVVDNEGEVAQAHDGAILNIQVVSPHDLPEGWNNRPRKAYTMLATKGGVINEAVYRAAGSKVSLPLREKDTAVIIAGVCESPKAVEDAFAEGPKRVGLILKGLEDDMAVVEDLTFHPNLWMALGALEERASSPSDWQFAVLLARAGGMVSTLYITPTSAGPYCIATWGDHVIYKAWEHGDKYGVSWSVSPLDKDGEDTILVLDRVSS